MLLVIDGYNLLKFMAQSAMVSPAQKSEFINKLALYALKKEKRILAVFDGGSYHKPEKITHYGIDLVHTGYYMSADTYIKEYIASKNNLNEVIIISSDRELCSHLQALGGACLSVHLFAEALEEEITKQKNRTKKAPKSIKYSDHTSSQELDDLMHDESFYRLPYCEKKDISEHAMQEEKISKKDKKREKLLKKL